MKVHVYMKDPDCLHDSVRRAAEEAVKAMGIEDDDEVEALVEVRVDKTLDVCRRWFEYGECVTLEIDTVAGTIQVLDAKR